MSQYPTLDALLAENFPYPLVSDDITNYIKERLGKYVEQTNLYYVEKKYIDANWRALYRKHYSKTYYGECSMYSLRVHFFRNSITEEDYLGFIILRPIPVKYALSKIVLRPICDFYGSDKIYMMTNEIEVNIIELGKTFMINAFTHLIQDAVAQVCADACVNMAANYLSKKFSSEFSNYSPDNLFPEHLDRRPIPSYGLYIYEISEILLLAGYRSYIERFTNKDDFISFVNAQIESSFPVIFIYDGHASVIAGHTLNEDNSKDYIIYDDSGYHLNKYSKGNNKHMEFSGLMNFDEIPWKEIPSEKIPWEEKYKVFAISFDFDKVFLRGNDVGLIIDQPIYKDKKLDRMLLIEFKELLKILHSDDVEIIIKHERNPHYVWWIENNIGGGIVVDASSHKYDLHYSIIAIANGVKSPVREQSPVGLLKCFEKQVK